MFSRLMQHLKKQTGFSLVEAIVSVVIVGIAVIPISTVFSLTVTRTVDTRKQLEANVIAQQYMENLKNKTFEDFALVLPAQNVTESFDNSTAQSDYNTYKMDRVPSGYRVDMSYATDVDNNKYKIDTSLINGYEPVDTIVVVPSGYTAAFSVRDEGQAVGDAISIEPDTEPMNTTERNIVIKADRISNQITINLKDGSTTEGVTYTRSVVNGAVRLEMGDGSGATAYDTTIVVDSNLSQPFKVFIYEKETNTVQASTAIDSGYVTFSRNLYTVDAAIHRVVEIQVDVYDEVSGDLLTSLTSTKISE